MTVYGCECGGCVYARDPRIKPLAYECERCRRLYLVHDNELKFPTTAQPASPTAKASVSDLLP